MGEDDDYYEKSGFYVNGNNKMGFATVKQSDGKIKVYLGAMDFNSKMDDDTRTFMIDNIKAVKIALGVKFFVSETEFSDFIKKVFNKGVNWTVANKDGLEVTIPGTWQVFEPETGGGSRKKRRSRKSKKRKARKSKKRRR